MSTTVKLGLGLLVSKGILPKDEMQKVFHECLGELGFNYSGKSLFYEGNLIGNLTLKDRIVLKMDRVNLSKHLGNLEKLRKLFAHRAEVAQKDYIFQKETKLNQSKHNVEVYNKLTKELEIEKLTMQKALQRQKKDSCQALKEELIEAAINNGFDVEEINDKNSQVQLQLVRREY